MRVLPSSSKFGRGNSDENLRQQTPLVQARMPVVEIVWRARYATGRCVRRKAGRSRVAPDGCREGDCGRAERREPLHVESRNLNKCLGKCRCRTRGYVLSRKRIAALLTVFGAGHNHASLQRSAIIGAVSHARIPTRQEYVAPTCTRRAASHQPFGALPCWPVFQALPLQPTGVRLSCGRTSVDVCPKAGVRGSERRAICNGRQALAIPTSTRTRLTGTLRWN